VPFNESSDLSAWNKLYQNILDQCDGRDDFNVSNLVQELNELTFHDLKLSFVVGRLYTISSTSASGSHAANAHPTPFASPYAKSVTHTEMLRDELDGFVNDSNKTRHRVQVLVSDASGLVAIQIALVLARSSISRFWMQIPHRGRSCVDVRSTLIERRASGCTSIETFECTTVRTRTSLSRSGVWTGREHRRSLMLARS